MIKVVLDTNTLVSTALNENSVSGKAFEKVRGDGYNPLTSQATLAELGEVLFRGKFDKYVSAENRKQFFADYVDLASMLQVEITITDCRDPKDNKFLELAVIGEAKVIISGDSDLLVLNPYRGILIMNSSGFLDWTG